MLLPRNFWISLPLEEVIKLLSKKFDDLNTFSLVTRLYKIVVSQYVDLLPTDY
jgi:hypothetical protein